MQLKEKQSQAAKFEQSPLISVVGQEHADGNGFA